MRPRPPVALIVALVGCDGIEPTPAVPGNELLLAVQADDYRSWARPPKGAAKEPLAAGQGPHGAYVDVYVDAVMEEALAAEPGSLAAWPDGARVVLDGWAAPEVAPAEGEAPMPTTLLMTTIMERRAGAWYFEEYVDGDASSPRFHGQPDVCVGCHAVDGDGLRTVALP